MPDPNVNQLSYKIKILFFNSIFSNQKYIDHLYNLLLDTDIFSIEYSERVFTLKIKKTNIKKKYNHTHDAIFYYGIVNEVFNQFLFNFKKEIDQLLFDNNINITIEDVINLNIVNTLYTITAIVNNIVFLKI